MTSAQAYDPTSECTKATASLCTASRFVVTTSSDRSAALDRYLNCFCNPLTNLNLQLLLYRFQEHKPCIPGFVSVARTSLPSLREFVSQERKRLPGLPEFEFPIDISEQALYGFLFRKPFCKQEPCRSLFPFAFSSLCKSVYGFPDDTYKQPLHASWFHKPFCKRELRESVFQCDIDARAPFASVFPSAFSYKETVRVRVSHFILVTGTVRVLVSQTILQTGTSRVRVSIRHF